MAGAPIGNQNANKPKRWAAAINAALDERAQKRGLRNAQEALEQLAARFLDAVEQGDVSAYKELADRLDGKAAQAIDLSGSLTLGLADAIKAAGNDGGPE